ncbi:CHAT domain-containing protein [Streptomyces rubiginosohelvolus]|uniref:CHAT domain-containing protein n=1 Tax=Streptomyces rubiginosohelvolus TaxID=67362 RepID=UPI00365207F0
MPDRLAALAALQQYLDRSFAEPARILAPETARAAADLTAVIEPETDPEASLELGTYHLLRSQVLAQSGVSDDPDALLRFMLPVFRANPNLVPEPLRTAFRTHPGLAPLVGEGPEALGRCAQAMVAAFNRSGELPNLRSAAAYFRAAVAESPHDHPDLPTRLNDLGVCLRDLYGRTRSQDVLAEAITTERAALRLARGRPDYGMRVSSLEHVLGLRAEYTGEPGAYAEAVRSVREALDALPPNAPERPTVLSCLADALGREHEATGRPEALDESLRAIREAVSLTPPGHPDRIMHLVNLTIALTVTHRRTGRPGLLEEAVETGREVVRHTPTDDPAYTARLASLGSALLELSMRDGEPGLVQETVRIGRETVAAVPQGRPGRFKHLNHLALALHLSYAQTRRAADMDAAAEVLREAVAGTPREHSGRTELLNLRITTLETLFHVHDRTDVLEECVSAAREVMTNLPSEDPVRAERLDQLCALLQRLFEHAGEPERLREAVRCGREAVDTTPRDHPRRAGRLTNLGGALAKLHGETGGADSHGGTRTDGAGAPLDSGTAGSDGTGLLRAAVACEREAVELTPVGEPERPQYLNNLSTALQRLFARTAHMADLERAVEVSRESVALAAPDDALRPMYLTNLGGAVRTLYLRVSRMELLEEAVQAERDATALIPPTHPRRAMYLNNLASTLQIFWIRTEQPPLLDEAIEAQREAVRTTPGRHPARAGRLIGLVSLLRMRYDRTERMEVLREAVALAREALALVPRDHPDAGVHLNGLAIVLLIGAENAVSTVTVEDAARFENPVRGTISQLLSSVPFLGSDVVDEAVRTARDAVRLTGHDHPERAEFLINLGQALETQAKQGGPQDLLDEALRCYYEAGDSRTATTFLRISGYRRYARVAGAMPGLASTGLRAMEDAVQLVETFAPRSLVRPDRQHQLSQLNELPGEAAAAALNAGRTVRAVELLEQTRGILASDILAQRSADQTRLRAHAPELAERLDRLRIRLAELDPPNPAPGWDSRGHGGGEPVGRSGRHVSEERVEAHRAWQELVGQIRQRPEFGDFLRAPTAARMARQAQDGHVVFVSTSRTRCDALILTAESDSPVQAVPLPGLTQAKAYDQAKRLRAAHLAAADPGIDPQRRIAAQRQILGVLEWLWDVVAEPVLTRVGHTASPAADKPWPRLWWCPVGIMAFLPLHAAGHHAESRGAGGTSAPRTVLDRVVPSYTTTVGALEHARARAHDADAETTVVVPVPGTPDSPLPGVREETRAISALVPGAHLMTDPTRDKVLEALHGHRIAHFACHALADDADPGRSRLLLPDHSRAPLTVTDISNLHLNGALAYLAACETGVTAPRLADEALHITSAFQLAGYRHVVGTLWSVDDRTAVELAMDFYGHLTDNGSTPPRVERSAHALHYATRRLRGRYPGVPTLWAAHTHSGP